MKTKCVRFKGRLNSGGYGVVSVCGNRIYAHRAAWIAVNGAIQHGMTIDHLCRNRACVNVEHMEVVSRVENTLRGEGTAAQNARKTKCKCGRRFSHTEPRGDGRLVRRCIVCVRQKSNRSWQRNGKKWIAKRRALGLCVRCGEKSNKGSWCSQCLYKDRIKRTKP